MGLIREADLYPIGGKIQLFSKGNDDSSLLLSFLNLILSFLICKVKVVTIGIEKSPFGDLGLRHHVAMRHNKRSEANSFQHLVIPKRGTSEEFYSLREWGTGNERWTKNYQHKIRN